MKNRMLPILVAATMLSGCSSIVSKSEYSVAINSNPDSAKFVVTNRNGQKVHSGVTPASVTLKSSSGYFKGESYTVSLNKEDYASKTFTLTSKVDGWYFGNILLGGLIGMLIVDPATGAMYNLPDRVDISLDQTEVSSDANQDLTLSTIDSLSEGQRSRLVPIQ